MKALLYCTKANPRLIKGKHEFYTTDVRKDFITPFQFENTLNGFIVAECEINKVEEIESYCGNHYKTKTTGGFALQSRSCLSSLELDNYLKGKGYALHLSNVKVFDEPKKLSEHFSVHYINNQNYALPIRKAPQNMCYYYDTLKQQKYVLISIKPEWLCKILNGEKTIEVRKQILNCLKEMLNDDK